MESLNLAAAALLSAAFVFTVLAIQRQLQAPRIDAEARVLSFRPDTRDSNDPSPAKAVWKRSATSIPFLSMLLSLSKTEQLTEQLVRAGSRLRPGEFMMIRLFVALVASGAAFKFAGGGFWGVLLAVVSGLVGYMLPRVYLSSRAGRRIERLNGQLVEFLSLVASSLRSGFSLLQSIESSSRRVGPPLEEELNRILMDVRLGTSLETALENSGRRVRSRDLDLILTAIQVQRTSGGNLSEVLDNLSQTMRDRAEVKREIKSLTAHPRLTARVVAIYPIAIAALLTTIRPEIWMTLWTETEGHLMLAAAFVLNLLAFSILRRLTQIDY